MGDSMSLSCPVCKAAFRSQSQCPRCGSDLSRLMWIVTRAWQLRQQARAALRKGRYRRAHDLSHRALDLHATASGHRLLEICRIMNVVHVEPLE